MNKQEIKKWLLENCVVDGVLDLSNLDFSDFEGVVDISNMKVKYNLNQNNQKVGGYLTQDYQDVKESIYQGNCKAVKNIFQQDQQANKVF